MTRILITGGAGFIGSHLADELLAAGYEVRALDDLSPQVHGGEHVRPSYLDRRVDLRIGDVRDPDAVQESLHDVDAVIHLAAVVGVGQSMYQIERYTSVNVLGTAVLMEALMERPPQKLIVASSMSVYGEGLYAGPDGTRYEKVRRHREDLENHRWEPLDPNGHHLVPLPTPETKQTDLTSIYALSKFDQERLCLITGDAYGIPTVALRFFNVYGPRQALSNPYTGVLAIFASRLLNDRSPVVFEDGLQRRDFISVHDVARGIRAALESDAAGEVFNIGTGQGRSVEEVAAAIAKALGKQPMFEVALRYRAGDIRHCIADITHARRRLGWEPQTSFEDGLRELVEWLADQRANDAFEHAREELERRGLTV
jgi:dTDP-L-rhamnose 4-epimerase